jgi:hypothetical protein
LTYEPTVLVLRRARPVRVAGVLVRQVSVARELRLLARPVAGSLPAMASAAEAMNAQTAVAMLAKVAERIQGAT